MRVPFFGDLDVVPSNILWLFLSYVMLRIGGKEFVVYHVNRTQSREAGKKKAFTFDPNILASCFEGTSW